MPREDHRETLKYLSLLILLILLNLVVLGEAQ